MAIQIDQQLTSSSGTVSTGSIVSPMVTFDRPQFVEGDDPIRNLIYSLPICKDIPTFKANKDNIILGGVQEFPEIYIKPMTPAEFALLSDDTVDTLLQVETWLKDYLTGLGITCSIVDPFA